MEGKLSQAPLHEVHLSGYQRRDHEIVDYCMTDLPGAGLQFRGPLPETLQQEGGYFVCVGAAQTFGCFCSYPYPDLVAQGIGLPALNLGYGGAGPEFFLNQEALLPFINRARFVVLQVMSARSQSNSYYECGGLEYVRLLADGRRMGAQAAFDELVQGPTWIASKLPTPSIVRRRIADVLARPDPRTRTLVQELQDRWLQSSLNLLDRIKVPVVLLWFSRRKPAYVQRFGTAVTTLGEFPQLVNEAMMKRLTRHVELSLEVVTSRGSPQPLVSRFTGRPTTVTLASDRQDLGATVWRANAYYPSPEMHEDAGRAIVAALRSKPSTFGLR